MNVEHEELLSLLVDGESVEPEALKAALADPDAARVLVDYARVHKAVRDDDARPRKAFYNEVRAELEAPQRTAAWRMPLGAAALVVLSVGGGIWIGSSVVPPGIVPVQIAVRAPAVPLPASVGAVPTSVPMAVVPDCRQAGPPAPARVVQFVPAPESRPSASAGGNQP